MEVLLGPCEMRFFSWYHEPPCQRLSHLCLSYFFVKVRAYVVRLPLPGRQVYLVTHPEGIKEVLQRKPRAYSKEVHPYTLLQRLFGQGLFTSEGSFWLSHRRLMQPAFHRNRLAGSGMLITEATSAMLSGWQERATAELADVREEMLRLTLLVVSQILFGSDLSEDTSLVSQALTTVNTALSASLTAPFPWLSFPTPRTRRLEQAYRHLDQVVDNIITSRRQDSRDADDVLSMLFAAREQETGEPMEAQHIHDEVMTLLIAGHDTISTALTWTWALLAQSREVEARLHQELDDVLAGQVPTVDDLFRLPYTRSIIDETLRLYPPAWIMGRKALSDDEIAGYPIPLGSVVVLCPYLTHRHPAWWEHPNRFDPQRFAQQRPPAAYFPFGAGPRMCIGIHLALMEMQLILATVAQRYRLQLVSSHSIEPEALLTLRPKGGLPMVLHRRAT